MNIRLILLSVVILAQLGWLGWQYAAREQEIAHSPHLIIRGDTTDPRDWFRGDYLAIDLEQKLDLDNPAIGSSFWWKGDWNIPKDFEPDTDSVCIQPVQAREKQTGSVVELTWGYEPGDGAAFWRQGEGGLWRLERMEAAGSPQDAAREGELRLPVLYNLEREKIDSRQSKVILSISPLLRREKHPGIRFYVPEGYGEFPDTGESDSPQSKVICYDERWERRVSKMARQEWEVEVVLRPDGSFFPVQVYLNGIPYNKAIPLLRQHKLPLK